MLCAYFILVSLALVQTTNADVQIYELAATNTDVQWPVASKTTLHVVHPATRLADNNDLEIILNPVGSMLGKKITCHVNDFGKGGQVNTIKTEPGAVDVLQGFVNPGAATCDMPTSTPFEWKVTAAAEKYSVKINLKVAVIHDFPSKIVMECHYV